MLTSRRTPLVTVLAGAAALVAGACSGGSQGGRPRRTTVAPATSTSSTTTAASSTTAAATTTTQPVAALRAHRPARDRPDHPEPPGPRREDRQPRRGPPADRAQPGRRRVRGEVEGITRFFAVFQSADSSPVGPIRSARTTDVNLVADAVPPAVRVVGRQPDGAAPDRRGRPHRRRPGPGQRPRRLLPRQPHQRQERRAQPLRRHRRALHAGPRRPGRPGAAVHLPRPTASRRRSATPSPASSCTCESTKAQFLWDAASKTWLRSENGSPHVDHDGVQIAPANVVIQFVSYVGVPGVGQSQQAVTVGEGEAWVFTDGKVVKGTWSRPDPKQPAVYKDAAGHVGRPDPGPHLGGAAPAGPGRRDPRRRRPAVASPYPVSARRAGRRLGIGGTAPRLAHVRPTSTPTRHRHLPRQAGPGRDAEGRRDHGRRHARAGQDRRGRRRLRRHGARAGAGRHPRATAAWPA